MFDQRFRQVAGPTLDALGVRLADVGLRPNVVTAVGWVIGVGACVAASTGLWALALVLWLANRGLDGLDGPIARALGTTDRGGFFDIVADFSIYGGFVAGVAVEVPQARLACLVLLLTYYVSGTAFLALSSLLERRRQPFDDGGRSLRFVGGLAEGGETVVAYGLFCLLPRDSATIAWLFAAMVGITAFQRIFLGTRLLSAASGSNEHEGPCAPPPA